MPDWLKIWNLGLPHQEGYMCKILDFAVNFLSKSCWIHMKLLNRQSQSQCLRDSCIVSHNAPLVLYICVTTSPLDIWQVRHCESLHYSWPSVRRRHKKQAYYLLVRSDPPTSHERKVNKKSNDIPHYVIAQLHSFDKLNTDSVRYCLHGMWNIACLYDALCKLVKFYFSQIMFKFYEIEIEIKNFIYHPHYLANTVSHIHIYTT